MNAPWILKLFLDNPNYKVDVTLCETSLEAYNERMAAFIAQKYDLVYRQGDAITTKVPTQYADIKLAHEELSKYMNVHELRWSGQLEKVYYFVFDSCEENNQESEIE